MSSRGSTKFSCGFCGAPMDKNDFTIQAIPDYNPDNYPHDICEDCRQREENNCKHQVTHEMATEAGLPEAEGTWI